MQGRRVTRLDRCPYGKMPDWLGPMLEKYDAKTGELLIRRPANLIDHPAEQEVLKLIATRVAHGDGPTRICN